MPGIKQYYRDIIGFVPLKLRALLVNSRPFTLLLPTVGGWLLVEASLISASVPTADPVMMSLGLISLALINAGGNNVNSAFDWKIDEINKPYRPVPRRLLKVEEAATFGVVLLLLGIASACFVNLAFINFTLTLSALTLCYSVPPFRLKSRLWANNFSQALIRGVLGPMACWSIFGDPFSTHPLALSSIMFSFILPAQASKDLDDANGDSAFNVRTLPVVYGRRKAVRICRVAIFVPFVLVVAYTFLQVLPSRSVWLLALIPLTAYFGWSLGVERRLDRFENNRSWVLFYVCMLAFPLGFLLVLY